MRVLATKWFAQFVRRQHIDKAALCEAISRLAVGLVDADLGGGIVKQRVARPGAGRSSGYRTIIAVRRGERAVFVYGFAKSEIDNVSGAELKALRLLGRTLLAFDEMQLLAAIAAREIEELECDGQDLRK